NGLFGLLKVIIDYVHPQKAKSFIICRDLIQNKTGLEIGGPSNMFSRKGLLPVYPYLKKLDNCNFSSETIWESQIKDGLSFKYDKDKPFGYQYILDSTNLIKITSDSYDFILTSHVIEHIANPIKALFEWVRILKNEGVLVIILPHKDGTFDHNRNITSLTHIIGDYNNDTNENDLTHLDEILELHDLRRDPEAGSLSQFKERSFNNFENRCLHHHVFDTYLTVKLIDFIKLQILSIEALSPYHIIIIARKSPEHSNKDILNMVESHKFKSPFSSDKLF
ncbi:MAG: methyltransferase domain-containing protein, partial [Ignavibacteria bacterium]|nr:methyltransferase domain-containing protein [Ignavibacteria bacterium]